MKPLKLLLILSALVVLGLGISMPLTAAEEVWECPECGAKIPASAEDTYLTCPNCGAHLEWFVCEKCLGEFVINSTWKTAVCPYCGAENKLD